MGDFVTEVIEIGLVDRLSRYVTIQVRDAAAARRARPQAVAKPPADTAASQKAGDVMNVARPTHVLGHRALRVHCELLPHAPDPGARWGPNNRKLRAGAKLSRFQTLSPLEGLVGFRTLLPIKAFRSQALCIQKVSGERKDLNRACRRC